MRSAIVIAGIVIAGHSSFSGKYAGFSSVIRNSMMMFADLVNRELGGVVVGGTRYELVLSWVDDESLMNKATLAMAHALLD